MAEDTIFEENPKDVTHLDIIENQLQIIASVENLNHDIYDDLHEHKIRAINNAFLIIHNCQYQLFNLIK